MEENKVSAAEWKEFILNYYLHKLEHILEDDQYVMGSESSETFEERVFDEEIDYDQITFKIHDQIMEKIREIS